MNEAPVTCNLTAGERITQVKMYKGASDSGYLGLSGIQFITNMKDCPLFGSSSDDSAHASGHRLLVLAGSRGLRNIKRLDMYFDYACQFL